MGATNHRIAANIIDTLRANGPCVALESTLVAHGLPQPENLATARAVEAEVHAAGATPATIAVVAGRVAVGLDDDEMQRLARPGDFRKAGRRDLAAAVAGGLDAATTVGATLWVARSCGIGVMATGGLGGVHRDAASTGDISNDLDELARADGAVVVCSGVKSILDVPATLEALEARGVLVVGYRTGALAGFTTLSSGLPLEYRVDSPAEAAALVRAHRSLGLPGAIVLAQPVDPALALDRDEHDRALADALAEARARGVSGKPLTPFLLDRLRASTEGRSLAANRALIVANARLAAEVAVQLSGAVEP
jgi:pseudouridine-5'-phosphate glycosidase